MLLKELFELSEAKKKAPAKLLKAATAYFKEHAPDFGLPLTELPHPNGEDWFFSTDVSKDDWETSKTMVVHVDLNGEATPSTIKRWKELGGKYNPTRNEV